MFNIGNMNTTNSVLDLVSTGSVFVIKEVLGNKNRIRCNKITVRGHDNIVVGDDNNIEGDRCTIIGKRNRVKGKDNITIEDYEGAIPNFSVAKITGGSMEDIMKQTNAPKEEIDKFVAKLLAKRKSASIPKKEDDVAAAIEEPAKKQKQKG